MCFRRCYSPALPLHSSWVCPADDAWPCVAQRLVCPAAAAAAGAAHAARAVAPSLAVAGEVAMLVRAEVLHCDHRYSSCCSVRCCAHCSTCCCCHYCARCGLALRCTSAAVAVFACHRVPMLQLQLIFSFFVVWSTSSCHWPRGRDCSSCLPSCACSGWLQSWACVAPAPTAA